MLGPCFAVWYFKPVIVLQLSGWRRERAGCFTSIVIMVSFGCLWSVSLPNGVMGWSAVWECGISWSYSLTFLKLIIISVLAQIQVLSQRHEAWANIADLRPVTGSISKHLINYIVLIET